MFISKIKLIGLAILLISFLGGAGYGGFKYISLTYKVAGLTEERASIQQDLTESQADNLQLTNTLTQEKKLRELTERSFTEFVALHNKENIVEAKSTSIRSEIIKIKPLITSADDINSIENKIKEGWSCINISCQ